MCWAHSAAVVGDINARQAASTRNGARMKETIKDIYYFLLGLLDVIGYLFLCG